MNELQIACPRCGKPVVFHGSFAMSSVCDECGQIVVRPGYGQTVSGGSIEPPIREESPLEFGMHGRYQGHDFDIRGVVRLEHDAGGFWDEWYLLFDDGRCGWLAEVQQRFYLTFSIELKGAAKIPAFEELNVEQRFRLQAADMPLKVAEKGAGRPIGARGEIPYELRPQAEYRYADLSGPAGRFATIDYGDSPPKVYLGQEVHLADLHLPHTHEDISHEPRQAEPVKTECPHCRHQLTLYVPHKTVRVGCTACGYLLDANEGRLQVVHATDGAPKLRLPIGSKGQLAGAAYTVIGYLKRSIISDPADAWDEYLLYSGQVGYRWLTCSDDHWNFVESVPPGEVEAEASGARYAGKTFRWTEQDAAIANCVLGEFYWKIDRGERVWSTDFVRPPEILSREITHGGPDSGEVSWSHGTYIAAEKIEQAFGLSHSLPRPLRQFASPNQPSSLPRFFATWGIMVGLTLLLGIFFQLRARRAEVFHKEYTLPAATAGAATTTGGTSAGGGDFGGGGSSDDGSVFFSEPFELRAHENVEIRVAATATNFWLGIDGDLVDEKTGVVQEFSLPIEFYQGVSEGESWSEGNSQGVVYLSALPAGTYVLRIVGQQEPKYMPIRFAVSVRQDVPREMHLFIALLAISCVPIVVFLIHGYKLAHP